MGQITGTYLKDDVSPSSGARSVFPVEGVLDRDFEGRRSLERDLCVRGEMKL